MSYKVAVVILNWNGRRHLEKFLPSVVETCAGQSCLVVVADNASTDDSVPMVNEKFPGVHIIQLARNYGFAGGYNLALQQVEADYFVLLNNDVEVTPGWLTPLISTLDKEPLVGAVMPKIRTYAQKELFEYAGACGGYLDKYGFPFCRGRVLNVVEADLGQYDTEAEVFGLPVLVCLCAPNCISKRECSMPIFCPHGRN